LLWVCLKKATTKIPKRRRKRAWRERAPVEKRERKRRRGLKHSLI
jgi:hypothetical protein